MTIVSFWTHYKYFIIVSYIIALHLQPIWAQLSVQSLVISEPNWTELKGPFLVAYQNLTGIGNWYVTMVVT